jgi:hypothetical protein
MAEYIERRTAIEHLNVWCGGCGSAVECILAEPAADVAPVVHGRKIEDGDIGCFWLCSLCGECLPYGANYCPNCGAKMDGGAE